MTHADFVNAIEGYYGEYPRETMKDMVMQYLLKYIDEDDLADLYASVLKNVSTQYRSVPDIAIFDDIIETWNPRKQIGEYQVGKYIPDNTVDEKEAAKGFAEFWNSIGRKHEA